MSGRGQSYYSLDAPNEYRKIKVGVKNLDDAVLNLGSFQLDSPKYLNISKRHIFEAIAQKDYKELRRISNYFYDVSGLYART